MRRLEVQGTAVWALTSSSIGAYHHHHHHHHHLILIIVEHLSLRSYRGGSGGDGCSQAMHCKRQANKVAAQALAAQLHTSTLNEYRAAETATGIQSVSQTVKQSLCQKSVSYRRCHIFTISAYYLLSLVLFLAFLLSCFFTLVFFNFFSVHKVTTGAHITTAYLYFLFKLAFIHCRLNYQNSILL